MTKTNNNFNDSLENYENKLNILLERFSNGINLTDIELTLTTRIFLLHNYIKFPFYLQFKIFLSLLEFIKVSKDPLNSSIILGEYYGKILNSISFTSQIWSYIQNITSFLIPYVVNKTLREDFTTSIEIHFHQQGNKFYSFLYYF